MLETKRTDKWWIEPALTAFGFLCFVIYTTWRALSGENFVVNKNKPTGPDIRYYDDSAVVLTAPPFNLKVIKNTDLCESRSSSMGGLLNTKLLKLKD